MELREYLIRAKNTMMPSCNNFAYLFLNLQAEVGEASKVSNMIDDILADECGDILWQSVVLFDFMQIQMQQPRVNKFMFISKELCFKGMFESLAKVNGIIAKATRKQIINFTYNNLEICMFNVTNESGYERKRIEFFEVFVNIKNELSNFIQLYYNLLHVCGFDINVIMQMNIDKLAKRLAKNEIINHG